MGPRGSLDTRARLSFDLSISGVVRRPDRSEAARSVEDVAIAASPVQVPIAGLGALLRKQQVKVIYSAFTDPSGVLNDLHYDSADALGMRPDKEFMAHVSLMRPDAIQQLPQMVEAFVEHDGLTADFDRLAMMRREGAYGGIRYRLVQEWQLT